MKHQQRSKIKKPTQRSREKHQQTPLLSLEPSLSPLGSIVATSVFVEGFFFVEVWASVFVISGGLFGFLVVMISRFLFGILVISERDGV